MKFHSTWLRMLLFVALLSSTASAQLGEYKNEVIDDISYSFSRYFQFEVTRSALTRTDRQRTFLHSTSELEDGNAAIYYYRACLQWQIQPQELRRQVSVNWDKWFECDIDDLPRDEVADFLIENQKVFEQLQIATRRKDCDWDHDFENMDYADFATYDLSEIHWLRSLGRLIQLQTRLEIANGDYEKATESISNSIKLGRDVAEIPAIVAGITGESIIEIAFKNVILMSGRKDSPNNLVALQAIKQPIVDYYPKIKTEHDLIERGFEILNSPETSNRSPEQWQVVFADAMEQMDRIMQGIDQLDDDEGYHNSRDTRAALLLARLYPIAKHELISAGLEKDKIESMPVGQVVAIQTRRVWDELAASLDGIANLPTAEAIATAKSRMKELQAEGYMTTSARGDFPLSEFTYTWLDERFVVSGVKMVNRELVMLQNVEKLRDFAAQQDALPSAKEYGELNFRPDPMTGKAFEYTTDGASSVLQTETRSYKNNPEYRTNDIRMEIKLLGK